MISNKQLVFLCKFCSFFSVIRSTLWLFSRNVYFWFDFQSSEMNNIARRRFQLSTFVFIRPFVIFEFDFFFQFLSSFIRSKLICMFTTNAYLFTNASFTFLIFTTSVLHLIKKARKIKLKNKKTKFCLIFLQMSCNSNCSCSIFQFFLLHFSCFFLKLFFFFSFFFWKKKKFFD